MEYSMKTNLIGIVIALMMAFAAAVGALAQEAEVSKVVGYGPVTGGGIRK